MQSTGHSSMQARSLRSTQGWAMTEVMGSGPPVVERAAADASRPSMPDMTGDPLRGTTGHRLTAGLTVGSRVVVRYRLEEGSEAAATDFLGELVARNDDFLVVDTRTERVKLVRADVIAAKDVPPPASRPGRAHERISAADLEKLMATGWPAVDRAGLGD